MSTGRIKQLAFSEGVTVANPDDLAVNAASFVQYATEAAFVSAEGTAAVGDAFYDTTLNVIKYYDGAWKTLAGTASPTLVTPIIDDYLELNEESAPSTPSSGKGRLYVSTAGALKFVNDAGITAELGSSSGSGEKNYVTNPSGIPDAAAAVPTGWSNVGDLDIVVTKTAADLPREYTTAAGLKITADSNTQSVADYVYYDFTLDDVDLNKKLKISWSQKTTGTYVAGDLAVVITTQADRTTALHTPITTAIPSADGVFTTSFDTGSTATLSLVIRATTDMATSGGIVISDMVVGPGTQPQGAVVGPWTSYTPTGTWSSNTTYAGKWRRVGDSMEIDATVTTSGAPTSAALEVNLPTGYTIDTSNLTNAAVGETWLGSGTIRDDGVASYDADVEYASTTALKLRVVDSSATYATRQNVTQAVPITFGASDTVTFRVTVPIAEWAGSGTLNVAQNDVEYAYNTTTTDAADTTAFGYGPAGVAVGDFTASRSKRCRFQTPIQVTDSIELEFKDTTGTWTPVYSTILGNLGWAYQNGTSYGAFTQPINTTDVDVTFNTYGRPTGATYGAAGEAWSSTNNNVTHWRVKKSSGGQAVGFGAATSTSAGLVSTTTQTLAGPKTFTGQLIGKGTTTNDAAAAGYIGESFITFVPRASATGLTTTTVTQIATINLTAGDWDISALAGFSGSPTGGTYLLALIHSTGASDPGTTTSGDQRASTPTMPNASSDMFIAIPSFRVSLSGSTPYYLNMAAAFTGGTCSAYGRISARRVR